MNWETKIVSWDEYLTAAHGLEPGWLYHHDAWASVMRDGFGVEMRGIVRPPGLRGRGRYTPLPAQEIRGPNGRFPDAGPVYRICRAFICHSHVFGVGACGD